jgi:hypothetical protein
MRGRVVVVALRPERFNYRERIALTLGAQVARVRARRRVFPNLFMMDMGVMNYESCG